MPHAFRSEMGAWLVSVGACLLLPGCLTEAGVREHFASLDVCPPSRVIVRERPDVDGLACFSTDLGTPSAEIAADPGRLAYFRAARLEERRALWRSGHAFAGRTVFEVTACGHRELVACSPPAGRNWSLDCVSLAASCL